MTTKIAETRIELASKALLPFLGVLVLGTALIAVFPDLVMWLPALVE
ncbi:hypothetical protein [Parenemella sanctibonifatiensis]|nr:hypothetical protein [Parenemella sanctibonifatiensis]